MKVSISCKFMSLSSRISGTSDDGREYDYYRASFWHDTDGELTFMVQNRPENQGSITRLAAHKFGDDCQIVASFVKSRKNSSWYFNFVEAK